MSSGVKDDAGESWHGGSVVGSSSDGDSAWSPIADVVHGDHPAPPDGERYVFAGLVGRGGMGHVLIAHDHVLDRDVALKIVRPDLAANPGAAERLANEARVTAALDHPGIVPIYDAGHAPDGAPFYVMRLVRGRSLADAIAERATVDARLKLLRSALHVCEAIAYAHHHGVVHRDIKPQNVMLGEFGEVQVMDWGLAERVGARERHAVGTTPYMSPEQARGGVVSAPSDVWSLGVLLLELVAGSGPRVGNVRAQLVTAAGWTGDERVPPELIAIINRCLADAADERYTSHDLADDLAHYLDGRRVNAYEYSLGALARRALRAWRVPIVVAAVALALLIAVLVVGNARLGAERDNASRSLARVLSEQAAAAFTAGDLPTAERLAVDALAVDPDDDDPNTDLVRAHARGALMARHAAPTHVARHSLPRDCHRPRLGPGGEVLLCLGSGRLQVWEPIGPLGLAGPITWRMRWTAPTTAPEVRALPERGVVLLSDPDSTLRLLDLASGEPVSEPRPWNPTSLLQTKRVAVGFHSRALDIDRLDGAPSVLIEGPCGPRSNVQAAAVDHDELLVALSCTDTRMLIGPLGDRPTVVLASRLDSAAPGETGPTQVAFGTAAGNRDLLVWGDARGRLGLARVAADGTFEALWSRVLPGAVVGLRFDDAIFVVLEGGAISIISRDGDDLTSLPARTLSSGITRDARGHVLTLGSDALTVWAPPPQWRAHRLVVAPSGLTGASPSPDGQRLAASLDDGRVVVMARDGRREGTGRPESALVKPVAWSADGGTIIGAWMTTNGAQRIDARTFDILPRVEGGGIRRVLSLSGDLTLLISYTKSTRVCRGDQAVTVEGLGDAVFINAGVSADGGLAVLVPELGASVTILHAGATPWTERIATSAPAYAVDVSRDGAIIVLVRQAEVLVLDPKSGRERRLNGLANGAETATAGLATRVLDIDISPDDRYVAGVGDDGSVMVWELATGRLRARARGHRERAVNVAYFPSGDLLATSSWDGTARLWDMSAIEATPADLARRVALWGETPPAQ